MHSPMKLLELKPYKQSCNSIEARNLSNSYSTQYGSPYPSDTPPYEIPHNILRFFKKLPKKLIPKLFALTHLDIIFREILLNTLALDDDSRQKFAQELTILAHDLDEPIQQLMKSFGDSFKTVLQAIPGLNLIYAVSDISDIFKNVSDSSDKATAKMNVFLERVDDLYDRSVGSNRLLASMFQALNDTLGTESGLDDAYSARRGSAVVGEASDNTIGPQLAAATASRSMSDTKQRAELSSYIKAIQSFAQSKGNSKISELMGQLLTIIDGKTTSDVSIDEDGEHLELKKTKGLGSLNLIQNVYDGLRKKYDKDYTE